MPKGVFPRKLKPFDVDYFWSRVNKTETCWLWTGPVNSNGYGATRFNRRRTYVHRISYEMTYGPIEFGLQVDHLCRVRNCVRPTHLEAVTAQVNNHRSDSRSAQQARQTHCIRGHEFTESNTYVYRGSKRMCRACALERGRARRATGYIVPSRRGKHTAENGRQWK